MGACPPRKISNLEARKCDFQRSRHQKLLKNRAVFVAFKNFSGRRCVEFGLFLTNRNFVFINEIQTDGDKRSYRRR